MFIMVTVKKISYAVAFSLLALPAVAQTANTGQKQAQGAANSQNAQIEQAQKMMKEYKISKKDFVANVERSFDSMDKNHDGFLTMDEISANGNAGVPNPAAAGVISSSPAYSAAGKGAVTPNYDGDDEEDGARPVEDAPKDATATAPAGKATPVAPSSSIPPVNR